eukprot:6192190-Pleurochrysis_carterae.AAC.2
MRNSSRKGRRRAVVEELATFEGAGGAVGSLGSAATRKKTGRTRRRQRRVRENFCGDGECASSWQTNESSQRYLALKNVSVWSLPTPTSDRHALRHIADGRFSARGNLHRDLDLAAGRPAVFAYTQSSRN